MHTGNTDHLKAVRTALIDILHQRSFLLSIPLTPARERRIARADPRAVRGETRRLDPGREGPASHR